MLRKCFFLKNYVTSGGAVSHIVLYYQISITHFMVISILINYQVSSVFKELINQGVEQSTADMPDIFSS